MNGISLKIGAANVYGVCSQHKALAVTIAIFCVLAVDSLQPFSSQLTVRTYVSAVQLYQRVVRPAVNPWVHCRYCPTCSEYSVEAVRTHGMIKGLFLTTRRLLSCFPNVPLGTLDPVPSPR